MSFYTADTNLLTKTLNVPFKYFEVLLFKQIKFRIINYFRVGDIQYFSKHRDCGGTVTHCLSGFLLLSCFLN